MTTAAVLSGKNLMMTYGKGQTVQPVLSGASLRLGRGEACALLGPSGSGKTTLLSILGCLLTPTAGSLSILDRPVPWGAPRGLTRLRREVIGFVFQQSNLLPFLSVADNVRVVGRNSGVRGRDLEFRITELLDRLGIAAIAARRPAEVSTGQRQRAAIARALVHRPSVILADEPTAALDWDAGQTAVRLLADHARSSGAGLLVVTHDARLVDLFDQVFHIEHGKVVPA
jgi:putative ABC transport system ATP-binding protein